MNRINKWEAKKRENHQQQKICTCVGSKEGKGCIYKYIYQNEEDENEWVEGEEEEEEAKRELKGRKKV